jgi:hypothetical protein
MEIQLWIDGSLEFDAKLAAQSLPAFVSDTGNLAGVLGHLPVRLGSQSE